MVYKKFLIIASKKDKAGIGITTQLSQFGKFDFYLRDEDIVEDKNLDLEKISNYDFIIFASKHQSSKGDKSLTIHAPGNWNSADYGGVAGKVCPTSAQFMKQSFETLVEVAKEHNLDKKYALSLEVTHHGPLIEKPCMFIEIGSSEIEWGDRKAAFVIAKTIFKIMNNFKVNPYNEVAIGIGGPHYCQSFNKIQEKSNLALSHIIPQYVMPITEEMIKEAIEKTEEDVDLAVIDWKGLGKSEERQKVLDILDKLYIRYKRTSEVNKEY